MKKFKVVTLGMCMLVVCSCATKQGTGALIGAGGGALLGGIIGKIAGNTAVGAAIGTAVGTGAGAIIGRHMDKVAAETAAQVQNAKVEEVTDANGLKAVKVTFDSGILFATNKATLNSTSKAELAKFSTVLKNNNQCYIDIYGHTDTTGNDGINIPLSNSRAQSVASYLKSCGVSASQLQNVNGKGSSEPVADNASAAGRQQNRRVEVFLYASQAMVDAANSGTLK
ncbi:OmpA/MotB/Pal peptidoglycan-associating domain protein [Segatella baroniae F0067]|uniref:OmpA/MotB/Pal peptidoglycan-associating domain protein n=1 Tax=Segatella baroniae F0067 TaxID=1115809 RepID=U2NN85_9BACT|nr:OmpA family protein [Segatella baroniae]ERK39510.1 OmpA/MotB/Pal peptidoglycan-associating domain protein [Segatella baroniae F0067]